MCNIFPYPLCLVFYVLHAKTDLGKNCLVIIWIRGKVIETSHHDIKRYSRMINCTENDGHQRIFSHFLPQSVEYFCHDLNLYLLCQVTIMRPRPMRLGLSLVETEMYNMMTSSNGNIFYVTGPLCGEFIDLRWIRGTKAGDAELWYFLWSAPKQTVE